MNDTRREFFIKSSAFFGGSFLLPKVLKSQSGAEDPLAQYPLQSPEHQIFSSCLQCNTGCGIKIKIVDGVAAKVDGNPYAPQTLYPWLPYNTPLATAAAVDGALCPKGQGGLQTVYDPYRIRKVLKRAGRRGENKWITIPFSDAIREIVEGGLLFRHVPGEENRHVPGLKELWALRDPDVAKQMEAELKELKHIAKEVNTGKKPKEELKNAIANFKKKFASHLTTLIDPDHPDLGPKNNQLFFAWGRLKDGRGHLIKRWVHDSFGSVNAHGHTTVCQGSLYFTGKAMSEQWVYDEKSHQVKWAKGEKFYWQADTGNCEFILFVGASPFEANYGPPGRTVRITQNLVEGKLKIAVVDPRLSKTAAKAWKWIPIKPGEEGALGLAMIRWIIENQRYDARYLTNANRAAANEDREPTFCNATWLVKINDKGEPEKFLRSHEIGLKPPLKKKDEKSGEIYEYPLFVVEKDGKLLPCDPNDEDTPVEGDLLVDREVTLTDGKKIRVKTPFLLLYEEAKRYTLEEWAEIAEVNPRDIVEIATEFTAHGKRAVADIHRGVSQHTNGFYNCFVFNTLNLLVGNYDWKGGFIKKADYDAGGGKEGQPFPLTKLHPAKMTPLGISIIRHGINYEETTLFTGYPAKRPFYPHSSDIYEEHIPSIGDQYPYPIKCLICYMGTPVYALPAGDKAIPILLDLEKLPLFISIDITVGETSLFADYIFPDLSYLERWEFHGSHPSFAPKNQPIRQPAIPPITELVEVFGRKMPISLEAFLLATAEKLGLPGFGPGGLKEAGDLNHYDDFYLKMVANVANGNKPGDEVPDASDEEVRIFLEARKHLPEAVFSPERWKKAVGERWWRKVIYVLNRGGRFEDYEKAYATPYVKNYGKMVNLYLEKVATTRSSMTGKPFRGYPTYIPPYRDCLDQPLPEEGYEFKLLTFREITMTKSRTISNYWLLSVLPENVLLINRKDALRLGLKEGDPVRVVSPSNPDGIWDLGEGRKKSLVMKVKPCEGIRPGCVSFALGFGHFAYGCEDLIVDGKRISGDPRRKKGAHLNPVMAVDPVLKNVSLADPVGGSVAFYDTKVKILPAL